MSEQEYVEFSQRIYDTEKDLKEEVRLNQAAIARTFSVKAQSQIEWRNIQIRERRKNLSLE
jgi:hypothetical protein